MRKLLTIAALLAATSAAAQEKLTTYTTNRYDDKVFTGSGFIYDHPKFTVSAEEQSQGNNVNLGYALQAREGPLSLQLDGDNNNHTEARLILTNGNFSFLAGAANLEDDAAYAGAEWSLKGLKEKNNIGTGFVYGDNARRESGYVFGRLGGIFTGYDWAYDGTRKFVVSYPADCTTPKGVKTHCPSIRWLNFTLNAEQLGGVDSVRALQDKITSPSESIAAPNINPLRFVARADQRGSGFNFQGSRTKRGDINSYAAEADAYVHGNLWFGANYDNANGNIYGIAFGQTEHPRLGPGRVPFSIRGDIKYNTGRRNISVGLHAAKRWKF
ncbi:MAG: hypothetical protein HY513_00745 [Candidatus Aenigmarchaeota archaeon]|nr:hypothetical protein [Candidatus Aenigmarchaeota archaeon]